MPRKKRDLERYPPLSPATWPMWCGLGLLWFCARILPLGACLTLGECLGWIMHYALPRRRNIALKNLELCFPELSLQSRYELTKHCFRAIGRGLMEDALAWWLPSDAIQRLVHISGWEYLEQAKATGKPILLCTGHFTTFELAARCLTERLPFAAVFRWQNNPAFDWLMQHNRARYLAAAIPRDDARQMITALKTGIPLWIAPDQDYGRQRSVFVDFFGVKAATITSLTKLARITGAVVLPYYSYYKNGSYELQLQPALQDFPGSSPEADAARINHIIAAGIRAHPEQYLWVHRRFKTRPLGEPEVYL